MLERIKGIGKYLFSPKERRKRRSRILVERIEFVLNGLREGKTVKELEPIIKKVENDPLYIEGRIKRERFEMEMLTGYF